jgi:DegV family protein with EDD domain
MPQITLLTDSSACLSPEVVRRHGIVVVPITIHLPEEDLRDGMPGAGRRVYDALARGVEVKSSAPTPVEYLAAIEEAPGREVLIVTPAAEFTSMHRSAMVAADLADRPVRVLDSRTAAAAQGLVVLAASRAMEEGASADSVASVAEDAARRAELVAALESLDHIRRSGRVPAFALDLARRLGVRPVFRFHNGLVERVGVPRSTEAALRRIRTEWASRGGGGAEETALFHAAAPGPVTELGRQLERPGPSVEFSPSMGIHTGPGVVGVAWIRTAEP